MKTGDEQLRAWRLRNPLRRWLLREPGRRTKIIERSLHVGRACVCQWSTGKVIPNLDYLVQLQDCTGIPLGAWGRWLRQKPVAEGEVCLHAS